MNLETSAEEQHAKKKKKIADALLQRPAASSPAEQGGVRRTFGPCTRPAAGTQIGSTEIAGATTRSSAPPTASTAPGSCSWKVYVKDGMITWESQQTDYPSVGPTAGVRAARVPPRRRILLVHLLAHPGALPVRSRRTARDVPRGEGRLGDPVLAWADIVGRPGAAPDATSRPAARAGWSGSAGTRRPRSSPRPTCTRSSGTVRTGSPDSRHPGDVDGLHAAGARFISLIGGAMLSFYDWYADLPVASPQVFGDQTDVPESGDWWNASYLIMWGSNVPVTRTPDAHWMTEARYRGTEGRRRCARTTPTTPSSPTSGCRRARHRRRPGDGDGPVILKEFFVDRRTPRLRRLRPRYTDLPFLVTLEPRDDGEYVPGQVPHGSRSRRLRDEGAAFKTVCSTRQRRGRGPERLARASATPNRGRPVEPRPRTASTRC